MDPFERALPRLQRAHRLMYEVAVVCADDEMISSLREAMVSNRDAQARLRAIELRVRDVRR